MLIFLSRFALRVISFNYFSVHQMDVFSKFNNIDLKKKLADNLGNVNS